MLTSFVTEPLLTGLGAGGYMLVAGRGREPALLDFFVEAPTRVGDGSEAELLGIDVSFGDADQVFHVGPASCGVYGVPAGVCEAVAPMGHIPLEELAAPAAQLAHEGVVLNAGPGVRRGDPRRAAELDTRGGRAVGARRARAEGGRAAAQPRPRRGARAAGARGTRALLPRRHRGRGVRLAARPRRLAHRAPTSRATPPIERSRCRSATAIATILTNPPPSAGGTLLAYSLALLDRGPAPPDAARRRRSDGRGAVGAHAGVRRGPRTRPASSSASSPPSSAPPPTSR